MNTYTSFCIAGCIFFIFISMSMGFIDMSGAFPSSGTTNIQIGNTTGSVSNMTGTVVGEAGHISIGEIWAVGTGLAIVGVVAGAILTKSTNMIGVYLFGTIFWSCWLNVCGIMTMNGFLNFSAGLALIGMITIGMTFMFIGAIIGMLSGSIWMR
jgi:hypothetical protein